MLKLAAMLACENYAKIEIVTRFVDALFIMKSCFWEGVAFHQLLRIVIVRVEWRKTARCNRPPHKERERCLLLRGQEKSYGDLRTNLDSNVAI